jgi:hypothetical protein
MINHARTLLLNVSGPSHAVEAAGEEHIPADYRAKTLPSYLAVPHRIIFGTRTDWLYRNYRARQLMTVLHNTELEQFVLDLDSRITYWPITDADLFETAFTPVVLPLVFNGGKLHLNGRPTADPVLGISNYRWELAVISSTEVSVSWTHWPRGRTTTTVADVAGLSSKISLPGSEVTVQIIHDVDAEGLSDMVGQRWAIMYGARPQQSLGELSELLSRGIGAAHTTELFGLGTGEPYATFRNLWNDHPFLPYKLGGLLLALIYRTNELGNG